MKSKFGYVTLIAICLSLVSCASTPRKLYDGPVLDSGSIVQIIGFEGKKDVLPLLEEIDGVPGTDTYWERYTFHRSYNSGWDGTFNIQIKPGHHVFVCRPFFASGSTFFWSKKPTVIEVDLVGGRTYYLYGYKEEKSQGNFELSCRLEETKWNPQ